MSETLYDSIEDVVHAAFIVYGMRATMQQIFATCVELGRLRTSTGNVCRIEDNAFWFDQVKDVLISSHRFMRCEHQPNVWVVCPTHQQHHLPLPGVRLRGAGGPSALPPRQSDSDGTVDGGGGGGVLPALPPTAASRRSSDGFQGNVFDDNSTWKAQLLMELAAGRMPAALLNYTGGTGRGVPPAGGGGVVPVEALTGGRYGAPALGDAAPLTAAGISHRWPNRADVVGGGIRRGVQPDEAAAVAALLAAAAGGGTGGYLRTSQGGLESGFGGYGGSGGSSGVLEGGLGALSGVGDRYLAAEPGERQWAVPSPTLSHQHEHQQQPRQPQVPAWLQQFMGRLAPEMVRELQQGVPSLRGATGAGGGGGGPPDVPLVPSSTTPFAGDGPQQHAAAPSHAAGTRRAVIEALAELSRHQPHSGVAGTGVSTEHVAELEQVESLGLYHNPVVKERTARQDSLESLLTRGNGAGAEAAHNTSVAVQALRLAMARSLSTESCERTWSFPTAAANNNVPIDLSGNHHDRQPDSGGGGGGGSARGRRKGGGGGGPHETPQAKLKRRGGGHQESSGGGGAHAQVEAVFEFDLTKPAKRGGGGGGGARASPLGGSSHHSPLRRDAVDGSSLRAPGGLRGNPAVAASAVASPVSSEELRGRGGRGGGGGRTSRSSGGTTGGGRTNADTAARGGGGSAAPAAPAAAGESSGGTTVTNGGDDSVPLAATASHAACADQTSVDGSAAEQSDAKYKTAKMAWAKQMWSTLQSCLEVVEGAPAHGSGHAGGTACADLAALVAMLRASAEHQQQQLRQAAAAAAAPPPPAAAAAAAPGSSQAAAFTAFKAAGGSPLSSSTAEGAAAAYAAAAEISSSAIMDFQVLRDKMVLPDFRAGFMMCHRLIMPWVYTSDARLGVLATERTRAASPLSPDAQGCLRPTAPTVAAPHAVPVGSPAPIVAAAPGQAGQTSDAAAAAPWIGGQAVAAGVAPHGGGDRQATLGNDAAAGDAAQPDNRSAGVTVGGSIVVGQTTGAKPTLAGTAVAAGDPAGSAARSAQRSSGGAGDPTAAVVVDHDGVPLPPLLEGTNAADSVMLLRTASVIAAAVCQNSPPVLPLAPATAAAAAPPPPPEVAAAVGTATGDANGGGGGVSLDDWWRRLSTVELVAEDKASISEGEALAAAAVATASKDGVEQPSQQPPPQQEVVVTDYADGAVPSEHTPARAPPNIRSEQPSGTAAAGVLTGGTTGIASGMGGAADTLAAAHLSAAEAEAAASLLDMSSRASPEPLAAVPTALLPHVAPGVVAASAAAMGVAAAADDVAASRKDGAAEVPAAALLSIRQQARRGGFLSPPGTRSRL